MSSAPQKEMKYPTLIIVNQKKEEGFYTSKGKSRNIPRVMKFIKKTKQIFSDNPHTHRLTLNSSIKVERQKDFNNLQSLSEQT